MSVVPLSLRLKRESEQQAFSCGLTPLPFLGLLRPYPIGFNLNPSGILPHCLPLADCLSQHAHRLLRLAPVKARIAHRLTADWRWPTLRQHNKEGMLKGDLHH